MQRCCAGAQLQQQCWRYQRVEVAAVGVSAADRGCVCPGFALQGYMTGGGVLNVMFAALMGSFSLGLVGGCFWCPCWLLLRVLL